MGSVFGDAFEKYSELKIRWVFEYNSELTFLSSL